MIFYVVADIVLHYDIICLCYFDYLKLKIICPLSCAPLIPKHSELCISVCCAVHLEFYIETKAGRKYC